jgi:GNAT superfamily N-acetyltransferase
MTFRLAEIRDIAQMHVVRMAVKENILPNPQLISERDYEEYLRIRGRGWLCEADKMILGFGIIDCVDKDIWALFVLPGFEGKGIG